MKLKRFLAMLCAVMLFTMNFNGLPTLADNSDELQIDVVADEEVTDLHLDLKEDVQRDEGEEAQRKKEEAEALKQQEPPQPQAQPQPEDQQQPEGQLQPEDQPQPEDDAPMEIPIEDPSGDTAGELTEDPDEEPTEASGEPLTLSHLSASADEVFPGETIDFSFETTGAERVEYVVYAGDEQVAGDEVTGDTFSWTPEAEGAYTVAAIAYQGEASAEDSVAVTVRPDHSGVEVTFTAVDAEGHVIGGYEGAALDRGDYALDGEAPVAVEGYAYGGAALNGVAVTRLWYDGDERAWMMTGEMGDIALTEDAALVLSFIRDLSAVAVTFSAMDADGNGVGGLVDVPLSRGEYDLTADGPAAVQSEKNYQYVNTTLNDAPVAKLAYSEEALAWLVTVNGETAPLTEDAALIAHYEEVFSERVYEYDDSNIHAVVTLARASAVPDDAELVVTPITGGDSYDAYMAALNDSAEQAYTGENTLLYDFAFMVNELDPETGAPTGRRVEFPPEPNAMRVSVTFKKNQLSDDLNAEQPADVGVHHMPLKDSALEDVDATVDADVSASDIRDVETVNSTVNLNGGTDNVEFSTDSFSVFAFTVEFHYEDKVFNYEIPGAQDIPLGEILAALGIVNDGEYAAFRADIARVSVSDPEVMSLTRSEADWIVRALKASDAPQSLTVAMGSGQNYVITYTASGITEVSAEGDVAVISTVNDLFLPEEASARAEIVADDPDHAAVAAVQRQTGEAEGGSAYQVISIGLDNVDAAEYEGFDVAVNLEENLVARQFQLYQVQDGVATDITESMQLTGEAVGEGLESVSGISFTTDAPADYVLCYSLEAFYTAFDGLTFRITVDATAEAAIPYGSELAVREILPDEAAYDRYLSQSAAQLGVSGSEVSFARFFDIQILKDGEKVEPKAPVKVTIAYQDAMPLEDGAQLSVVHFADAGTEVISDVAVTGDSTELTYQQASFSVTGTIVTAPENGKNYVLVIRHSDGEYYIVENDGMLLPVDRGCLRFEDNDPDGRVVSVAMDTPIFWTYNEIGDGEGSIWFNFDAKTFTDIGLPLTYTRRYIDAGAESGFVNVDEGAATPIPSVKYTDGQQLQHGDNYIGVTRKAGSLYICGGIRDSGQAATVFFAEATNISDMAIRNHTVNHIDIAIKGKASINFPLAYGQYKLQKLDDNGNPVEGAEPGELTVSSENPLTIFAEETMDIELSDMKKAKVTATYKNDSGTKVEYPDAFKITGYSRNQQSDAAAGNKVGQIRLEGTFKVAKLDPVPWNDDPNNDTVCTQRLNNRVYYDVAVTKPVTFHLIYEDPDTHVKYAIIKNGTASTPFTVTVDITLEKSFDFWEGKDDWDPQKGNECPGVRIPLAQNPLNGEWTTETWKKGGIPDNSEWTNNPQSSGGADGGPGMDFTLDGDLDRVENGHPVHDHDVVAIEVTKFVQGYDGEDKNTVHLLTLRDGTECQINVYQRDETGSNTTHTKLHDETMRVGNDGVGSFYDYDVAAGSNQNLKYTKISEDADSVEQSLYDENGKKWVYDYTVIETENVWRGNDSRQRHREEYSSNTSGELDSVEEVIGEYYYMNGDEKITQYKDDDGKDQDLFNRFLEFYIYNVYKPAPFGYLRIKKDITVNGQTPSAAAALAAKKALAGTYEFTVYTEYSNTVQKPFIVGAGTARAPLTLTVTIGEDGATRTSDTVELPEGTYYIKETTPANEDVTPVEQVVKVTVTASSTQERPVEAAFTNNIDVGSLKISKTAKVGDVVASTLTDARKTLADGTYTFGVYTAYTDKDNNKPAKKVDGSDVGDVMVEIENGTIKNVVEVEDLKPGTYYVVETAGTNSAVTLDTTPHSVTVEAGKVGDAVEAGAMATAENVLPLGSLEITKAIKTADGADLAVTPVPAYPVTVKVTLNNVEYYVQNVDGELGMTAPATALAVAAGGKLTINNLPYGSYAVTEVNPGQVSVNQYAYVVVDNISQSSGSATVGDTKGEVALVNVYEAPQPPHKKETAPYEGTGELGGVKVGDEITYQISYKNYKGTAATVTIKDKLDANVAFVSADPSATQENGVVTWTIENVAAGETGSVTLKVKVREGALVSHNPAGPGKVVNGGKTATVQVGNDSAYTLEEVTNPVPEEPKKEETAPYQGTGELGGVKVGDKITYEISYRNYKSAPATVTIVDRLDANVEPVLTDPEVVPVKENGVYAVTWTIPDVPAGQEGKVTLTVEVLESALTSHTPAGPGAVVNGGDTATVQVGHDHAFTLEEVMNPVPEVPQKQEVKPYSGTGALGPVKVGDEITYEISYRNYKSAAATVTIKDALDPNVAFVEASDGGKHANGTVTWTIANVPAGQSGKVTLKVKVLEGALESKGGEGEVVNGGDTATVQVGHDHEYTLDEVQNPVPEPPHKRETGPYEGIGELGTVKVGDEITYEISYHNYLNEAADVVIVDKLDKNVSYVASSDGGKHANGTVTWTLGNVPAGTEGKVTLTVKVLKGALKSAKGPGVVVNGGDTATVQVDNDSKVTLETVENPVSEEPGTPHKKETAPYQGTGTLGEVKVGDEITYEISYRNYKSQKATVKIVDKLDANVSYVASSDGGKHANGTVTWTLGNVPAGREGKVTLTVKVLKGALKSAKGPGVVVNGGDTATVQVDNDSKVTLETVENPVSEELGTPHKKETAPFQGTGTLGEVKVGDEITYEISYRNYKGTAANVTIKDTLDANVAFVKASDGGKHANGTVTWSLASVPAGREGKVTLTVKVQKGALKSAKGPGVVVNGGQGTTVQVGNDPAVSLETVENPVSEEPETPQKKETAPYKGTGTLGEVKVGDEITYEISYRNYKSEKATVKIVDKLDENVAFVKADKNGKHADGIVTWTITDVPAGTEGKVTLTVKVLEDALKSEDGPGKVVNGGQGTTVQIGNDAEVTLEPVENPVTEVSPTPTPTPDPDEPEGGGGGGGGGTPEATPVPKIDIEGTKVWDDQGNAHGVRPSDIVVTLLADGEPVDAEPVWESQSGDTWSFRFENLPQYNDDDELISYTVQEEPVPYYTASISGTTITNTLEDRPPEKTVDLAGEKTWIDGDNAKGTRPASITVHLLRDGEIIQTVNVTAGTDWRYEFKQLPADDGYGHTYTYTIDEDGVPGYYKRINGANLTNGLAEVSEPNGPEEPEDIPEQGGTPAPNFEDLTDEELEALLDVFGYGMPLYGVLPTGDELPLYPFAFGGAGLLALALFWAFRKRRA